MDLELKTYEPPPEPWVKWAIRGNRGTGKTYAAMDHIARSLKPGEYAILVFLSRQLVDWAMHDLARTHETEIDHVSRTTSVIRLRTGATLLFDTYAKEARDKALRGLRPAYVLLDEPNLADRRDMYEVDRHVAYMPNVKVIITAFGL